MRGGGGKVGVRRGCGGHTDFFDRRTEGHVLGTQNARTYTEFNLLAKRAEDLRAQRYWGFRRDARFVRPHSAW